MRAPSLTRRDLLRGAAAATGGLVVQSCSNLPRPAVPARTTWLPGGLEVRGTRFFRAGKPFYVSGFNYWAATTLARDGNAAGWNQVRRDLDGLQAAGINMIRTMGATEGPDTEPLRIVPALQKRQGEYDAAITGGVVRVAEELQKHGIYGIFMLNNFWQWSGGMAQHLAWAGQGPIPYPPPQQNGA